MMLSPDNNQMKGTNMRARYVGRAARYSGHIALITTMGANTHFVKVRWLSNNETRNKDEANLPIMRAEHFIELTDHQLAESYRKWPQRVDERPSWIPAPEDDFAALNEGDLVQTPLGFGIGAEVASVRLTVKGPNHPDFKKALEALTKRATGPGFIAAALDKAIKDTFQNQQQKEQQMAAQNKKRQDLMVALQDDLATVKAVYVGNNTNLKQYTYKVPKSWDVQAGDHLVVDSPSVGFAVVRVVSADTTPDLSLDVEYKWAVQKVDANWHVSQLQREREFLERLAEVDRLAAQKEMVEKAREALGTNTAARKEFDAAVKALKGKA